MAKVDPLITREALLWYAMHVPHVEYFRVNKGSYSPHVGEYDQVLKIHTIEMEIPTDHPEVDIRGRQMLLFDWLCESLGEDPELLDHFATRLMERLHDLTKASPK